MATRYITVAQARTASGITSIDLISDVDFDEIIGKIEYEVERILNTRFEPQRKIDIIEGDNTHRLILRHNPVLRILAVNIEDTDIDLDEVQVHHESGVLSLTGNAALTVFRQKSSERYLARVKYDYGILDETTIQTTTDDAETAGTAVVIGVADASSFSASDYIEIVGMDGKKEVCQISSIASNDITVDQLTQDHEADSLVTKVETSQTGKRIMLVAASLAGVARVVGSTFDEITRYSIGELEVSKGEPFTQWRQTAIELQREWVKLRESFRTRPAMG